MVFQILIIYYFLIDFKKNTTEKEEQKKRNTVLEFIFIQNMVKWIIYIQINI